MPEAETLPENPTLEQARKIGHPIQCAFHLGHLDELQLLPLRIENRSVRDCRLLSGTNLFEASVVALRRPIAKEQQMVLVQFYCYATGFYNPEPGMVALTWSRPQAIELIKVVVQDFSGHWEVAGAHYHESVRLRAVSSERKQ